MRSSSDFVLLRARPSGATADLFLDSARPDSSGFTPVTYPYDVRGTQADFLLTSHRHDSVPLLRLGRTSVPSIYNAIMNSMHLAVANSNLALLWLVLATSVQDSQLHKPFQTGDQQLVLAARKQRIYSFTRSKLDFGAPVPAVMLLVLCMDVTIEQSSGETEASEMHRRALVACLKSNGQVLPSYGDSNYVQTLGLVNMFVGIGISEYYLHAQRWTRRS
jgi:hypothetical protein